MRYLATEQPVVHAQIEHRSAEFRNLLGSGRTNQIAHGVEGGNHTLVEQQADSRLDLGLGRAGRQVSSRT